MNDQALRTLILGLEIPDRLIEDLAAARTRLTEREEDVVRLAALGHTEKTTARVLGVSRDRVRNLRKVAKERLGVDSMRDATIAWGARAARAAA